MRNKNLLLVLSLLTSHILFAQDVIVKRDGSTILSKVMEIGTSEVKYKKYSNPDGPLYTISISELLSINYQNGEKETFDSVSPQNLQPQAKATTPDTRNTELIQLYNKDFHLTEYARKHAKKNKAAKTGILFFKVDKSSVMSNEELEMSFVTCTTLHPDPFYRGKYPHMRYNILLKNKTDNIIYVDLGTCMRVSNWGEHRVYYTSEEVAIGHSSGGSTSLGVGAVAGALGVGGVIGTLANGVGINHGSGTTLNRSYNQMRVLSIPPHSTAHLTDFKYLEGKKGTSLTFGKYTMAEKAEEFNFGVNWDLDKVLKHLLVENTTLNVKQGIVSEGEEKEFTPEDSPLVYNYIITYSTTNDFSIYSTLNSTLYVSKIAGLCYGYENIYIWMTDESLKQHIEDYNHYTICGPIKFLK